MLSCVEFPGGFFLGVQDDLGDKVRLPRHQRPNTEVCELKKGPPLRLATMTQAANGESNSMLWKIQRLLYDYDDVTLVDLGRNLVVPASNKAPPVPNPVTGKVGSCCRVL